jgi:membrane protease YdiL (CAAX protease family)
MTASPSNFFRLAIFFLLAFVLSVPFYLLGAVGGRLPGLPILPTSALMTFAPMIAAMILVYRQRGADGVVARVKRMLAFSRPRGAGWYLTALLFMPAVCVLEFGVLRLTGSALPLPHIAPGEALFFFLAFFIGAIGEELGWQGYAYPGLRVRRGALGAALVLGAVWALWHLIPFIQLGRGADWIFWHCLSTVALRIVIVWLFENTGKSIFIAVLFHAMVNLSWALFPNSGSYYDPFVTFVILALAVGSILLVWGPATLARFRSGGAAQHEDLRPPDASPEKRNPT